MKDLLDRMIVFAPEGNEGGAEGDQVDGDQEANDAQEGDEPTGDQQAPATIPYSRFKEVNERLAEATQTLKDLQSKQEKERKKQAEEQGKFEDLYKEESEKRATVEAELLKLKVGVEMGLPMPLINRLQGSTEAELKADAEQLKELIPSDGSGNTPGADPRRKKSGRLDISNMSPEEIRKNAGKLLEQVSE